jgi:hypothetical protein
MIAEPLDLERSVVQSLAQRYRDEGYGVAVEPRPDELPPALRRFRPDIVAQHGAEGVVVEVKRRQPPTASAARDQIEELASAVRALPNWRFELVVIDDALEGPIGDGRDWSEGDVEQALREVEDLVDRGRLEPALLLLFAAAEARLRSVAAEEGVVVPSHGVAPLISALTSAGVLSREDYARLMDGLTVRNAVAHGRRPDAMADGDTLRRLLATLRQVGDEATTA